MMEYTEKHIKRLRKLINDVDSSDFDDDELEGLLEDSPDVYIAASQAWAIKAGLLQGQIESYSAGQEKYETTSLKDQLSHAMTMANHYKQMGTSREDLSVSSYILGVKRPEVL